MSFVDLEELADALGVRYVYLPEDTISHLGRRLVIVDSRLSLREQREVFAHELSHVLLHSGNQLTMPPLLRDLQERQADQMALMILIPEKALRALLHDRRPRTETELMAAMAEIFDVTEDFACRRWRKYQARREAERMDRDFQRALKRMPQLGRDYDQTLTIGNVEYYYRAGDVVFSRWIGG